jgi:hypothetical protein
MENKFKWTPFVLFPSPYECGYLNSPICAGVYELKNFKTNELVYVGEGANVAYRMSSLLPEEHGAGTRNNLKLRQYILENVGVIHYRTLACCDKATSKKIQDEMIATNKYIFN